jgi:cell division protein FtsQ
MGLKKIKKSRNRPMAVPATDKKTGTTRKIRLRRLLYVLPAVFIVGLVLAGMHISKLFAESASFRLSAMEVQGLRLLDGQDILEASGLQVGDNIFDVDLEKVGDRLESLPWVKRALVVRKPPDRLIVSIVERQRLAWIELGEIYGIDRDGVLLPGRREAVESYRDLDLPVVRGVQSAQDSLRVGEAVVDSALVQLLDWWQQANAADAEFCMNVSEIQPLEDGCINLRLVGDGVEVRVPIDRVAERLRVLKKLMGRVYRECPEPAYIDLRFAGQVVVGSKKAGRRS